jgi:hypothetical protein
MNSIRSGAGQIYWDVPFVIAAIAWGDYSGRTSAPTRRPCRPSTAQGPHRRLVRQPIGVDDCAVFAPARAAVDEKVEAAVPPDVRIGSILSKNPRFEYHSPGWDTFLICLGAAIHGEQRPYATSLNAQRTHATAYIFRLSAGRAAAMPQF